VGADQAKTKSGLIVKQVVYGAVIAGGITYLAHSVGSNKPETKHEKKSRNQAVLIATAIGGLAGLLIGLVSKKVEKK
jgi:hypothetical protein